MRKISLIILTVPLLLQGCAYDNNSKGYLLSLKEAEQKGNFELVEKTSIETAAIQRGDVQSVLIWNNPGEIKPGWYQISFPASVNFQIIPGRLEEYEPFIITVKNEEAPEEQHSFSYKDLEAESVSLEGLPDPLLDPTAVQTWHSSRPLWIGENSRIELAVRRPLLVVGDLRLEEVSGNELTTITADGEAPYNMFNDDKPVVFDCELKNLSEKPFRGTLRFILKDAVDGSEQTTEVDVKVDGNNSWSEDMEWRPEFGAYRLTLETRNARGKVLYREHRHFTYSPYIDPKELPDSWPIGFHRHSSSPEMIPPMGVKWVRLWGGWGNMEPEPGKYEWEMMDVNVRMAKKYGYNLLWVCHGIPTWALPEEVRDEPRAGAHYAPQDMDRLRPFLRDFWKRYGESGVVKAVEVGNELNAKRGWTPEEYAQLARVIYEETHKASDGVRVVGISMSGGTHIDYMEKSMDAGGDKYMDIASVHLYEISNPLGERSIERKIRLFKESLKKYGLGDMPVWNTESGSNTDIRQDGVMISQEDLNRQIIQHPDFDPEMAWRVGNDWRGVSELLGTSWMIRASYQQFALGVEKNFPFQWSATPHHHWVHDWDPGGNVMPKIKVVATGVMSSMLRDYGPQATSDQPEIESPEEDWHAFAHRYEGPKGRMTIVYVHPKTYTGSGDQVAALAAGDDIKTKAENTLSPWLRTSEPEPVDLKIPVDSEQVVVMDMFGKKRKPVEVVNGFALIAATEVPQYLIEL